MESVRFLCDGLPSGDVLISEILDEVPESVVCSYFGGKSSKSGWNYCNLTTSDEQAAILGLYRRVYEIDSIPNKEITLSFARGLILMSQGVSVNWSQFSAERRKLREALKRKADERKEKKDREGQEGAGNCPSILGKRRFQADKEGLGFPESLSLTVKTEGRAGGISMGKRSATRLGKSGVQPRWVTEEVEVMEEVVASSVALIEECKLTSVHRNSEVVSYEDKLRRAKLLLSDRLMMLEESKGKLIQLSEEESSAKAMLESRTLAMADMELQFGGCNHDQEKVLGHEVDNLNERVESVIFRKGLEKTSIRLSEEDIKACQKTIAELEDLLTDSQRRNSQISHRVSCLETLMVSMKEQLARMKVGDGAVFFPRPVLNSPQSAIVATHTLNACLVCSLWFKSFDYCSLACGHTYHPFCLYEHSLVSSQCLLDTCKKPFEGLNASGIGIRPTVIGGAAKMIPKQDVTVHEAAPTTSGSARRVEAEAQTWEKDSPEKTTPLSQSSVTNATLKACPNILMNVSKPAVLCEMCSTKPATVFIKPCGHDVFCFACLQGLQQCPICLSPVAGWGGSQKIPKQSPFLPRNLGSQVATIAQSNAIKTAPDRTTLGTTLEVDESSKDEGEKGDDENGEQNNAEVELITPATVDAYDSSDSEKKMLHWSSNDVFKSGGSRSGQDIVPTVEASEWWDDLLLPTVATTNIRVAKRSKAVSDLLTVGAEVVQNTSDSAGQKKRGHSAKATKSLSKLSKDLVAEPVPAEQVKKRGVGRPMGKSMSQALCSVQLSASSHKQAPMRSRTGRPASRRRNVHDGIPVKFRGLE